MRPGEMAAAVSAHWAEIFARGVPVEWQQVQDQFGLALQGMARRGAGPGHEGASRSAGGRAATVPSPAQELPGPRGAGG